MRFKFLLAALLIATGSQVLPTSRSSSENRSSRVRELEVRVGDRVTFVNGDTVTHNVYSETKGMEFEIELQPPGRKDTVSFARPGTVEVRCAIHSGMKLRVDVKP
jgi:plastocyanin